MRRERKTFCFKEWESKIKKIKPKKDISFFAFFVILIILIMIFGGLYFKFMFEQERLALRKELGIILEEDPAVKERREPTSAETLFRLRETGVERYFLSEVQLIDGRFTPAIHACLFGEEGDPLYPRYVYETWSAVRYPEQPPTQIALMRYLLLPEDNLDFQPDTACYIKEIKTEADWREVEEKYGFSRRQFPASR